MTRVLLITDMERVQRVFQLLEASGLMQLRYAAALGPDDLDVADFPPDFVFLQSRISGFSSDLALRPIKKTLFRDAKVVLLAIDDDDALQASKQRKSHLALSLDDEALAEAIRCRVTGTTSQVKKVTRSAAASTAGKRNRAEKAPPLPADLEESAKKVSPPQKKGASKKAPLPVKAATEGSVAVQPPAPAAAPGGEPPGDPLDEPLPGPSSEEPAAASTVGAEASATRAASVPVFQWISEVPPREVAPPDAPSDAGEDVAPAAVKPDLEKTGRSFAEIMMEAAATPGFATSLDPPEASFQQQREIEPVAETADDTGALPHREMHRNRRRRPQWVLAVAIAALLIPVLYFGALQFRQDQRQRKVAAVDIKPEAPLHASVPATAGMPRSPNPAQAPALASFGPKSSPQATGPAAPPAAAAGKQPSAPAPPAATAARPPAAPVGRMSAAQAANWPQPTAKAVITALPRFMAGAEPDPGYGKKHPGWQRYIGEKAEYKLFKDGDAYRAMQVIALQGQAVSEEIYRKTLQEFGGIQSYHIQSSSRKGNYLIEEAVAKEGIRLMIYRKKADLSMKGLAIYHP